MKIVQKLGIVLIWIVLVVGFFYQTILYQKLPVPSDALVGLYHPWRDAFAGDYARGVPFKNFLITDPVRQQIPWKKITIETLKTGRLPGWNPYVFAGVPLDANIQAAPFYPLNVLFFVFDFPVAWTLYVVLQPILSGIFFFVYARSLGLTRSASLLGALSWSFGGFAIAWLTWGTIVHAALWLPLLLLSIDKLAVHQAKRRYYIRWSACLIGAASMTIFGGHMQIAFYILLFGAAYFIWRRSQHAHSVSAGWIVLCGVAVLVITLVQSVPFVEFLMNSGRVASVDSWKTAGWFMPWQHLVQFMAPDFFGNPATLNYWGEWNYGEFIGYVGVLPLLLALSALWINSTSTFFTVTILVSLLFMLPSPVSRLPFILKIPILSVLQPTRLMVLVDFALAVLAAYGFDRVIRKDRRHEGRLSFLYALALVIVWGVVIGSNYVTRDSEMLQNFAVARHNLILPTVLFVGTACGLFVLRLVRSGRMRMLVIAALVSVTIFDLFRFGWKFTPFTPVSFFFPTTKVIDFLQRQHKPFRVMTLDDRILPPNVSAYYGIESIEGYDPIAPKLYENFLVASERGEANLKAPTGFNRIYTAHNIGSPILPYFNVKYVLSLSDETQPFLREIMREGQTRVYEYTRFVPRIYFADTSVAVLRTDQQLASLFTRHEPLLGLYGGEAEIMNTPVSADESIYIKSYDLNEIRLTTKAKSKRLLVVLNRYDQRWKASVDLQSAPLLRTNYLFTGLEVPAGTHDVILTFRAF